MKKIVEFIDEHSFNPNTEVHVQITKDSEIVIHGIHSLVKTYGDYLMSDDPYDWAYDGQVLVIMNMKGYIWKQK